MSVFVPGIYLRLLRQQGHIAPEKTGRDGRDPDPTKRGIFRDNRCWKCNDGEKPCVQTRPGICEYPQARNG